MSELIHITDMSATVNVVTVEAYGEHPKWPLAKISLATFSAWALYMKNLLRSEPALARNRLILRDSISPAAIRALWAVTPKLQAVARDYASDDMMSSTSAARVTARMDWHEQWLDRIIHACAPETSVDVLERMAAVKFGEEATGRYSHANVMQYMAKLYELQDVLGDAMRTGVTDKQKLDVVERAVPYEVRQIMQRSRTVPEGANAADHADTWEQALTRLAQKIKEVEETSLVAAAIAVKPRNPPGNRANDGATNKVQNKAIDKPKYTRKEKKAWKKEQKRMNQNGGQHVGDQSKQKNKTHVPRGDKPPKDLSHVTCYTCNKTGHYANKCPEQPKTSGFETAAGGSTSGKGSGKGKGKGAGKTASKGGGKGSGAARE